MFCPIAASHRFFYRMKQIEYAKSMIERNDLSGAISLLNEIIAADEADDEALFLRGMAYWKLGDRARATTDYASAVAVNPSSKAAMALEMARDVESFFNSDLMNP